MKSLLWGAGLVSLGLAGAVGYSALDSASRVPTWLGGAGDLDTIQAQVAELETEIERLAREAELLTDDPLTIERAIREDLRMARAGEIVIHLPKPGGQLGHSGNFR